MSGNVLYSSTVCICSRMCGRYVTVIFVCAVVSVWWNRRTLWPAQEADAMCAKVNLHVTNELF